MTIKLKVMLVALALVMVPTLALAEGGARNNYGGIGNTYNQSSASSSSHAKAVGTGVGIGIGGSGGAGGQGGDGGNSHSSSNATGGKAIQGQAQGQSATVSSAITVEGDDYPVSSAYAGMASNCVNTLGVQSSSWGASMGGASATCLAQGESKYFLEMAVAMNDLGLIVERDEFIEKAIEAARYSELNDFELWIKSVKDGLTDAGIPIGVVYLLFAL